MSDENISKASFLDHFAELRSRLINCFIYLFIIFIISYFFAENIYSFLVNPYAEAVKEDDINRRLIFTALHETFITYLNFQLKNNEITDKGTVSLSNLLLQLSNL